MKIDYELSRDEAIPALRSVVVRSSLSMGLAGLATVFAIWGILLLMSDPANHFWGGLFVFMAVGFAVAWLRAWRLAPAISWKRQGALLGLPTTIVVDDAGLQIRRGSSQPHSWAWPAVTTIERRQTYIIRDRSRRLVAIVPRRTLTAEGSGEAFLKLVRRNRAGRLA